MTDLQTVAQTPEPARRPLVGYTPFLVGLRYLLRKKLAYLAVLGVALSVGVIIVVMSVFTGFHLQFKAVIRGYLSDLKVVPRAGGMYAMDDWQLWRERALGLACVKGAAPFIEGAGLMRRADTGEMRHVLFRGVDPQLEPTVSKLAEYMEVGTLDGLNRTYPNPEGGRVPASIVGHEFLGRAPPDIQERPRELVLVTATGDLRRRLLQCAVNGVFKTGSVEYDSQFVILGLDTAVSFVDSGGGVTGLDVKLDDYRNAEAAREQLKAAMQPGTVLKRLEAAAPDSPLAISGDGRRVAAADRTGLVHVRNAQTGEEVSQSGPHSEGTPITALALDSDGAQLLVGTEDGGLVLRPVAADGPQWEQGASGGAVTAAAFSPFGDLVAVGRVTGRLQVFDVEEHEPVLELAAHEGAVLDVAFSADGKRVVTVGADGSARVWDAQGGGRLAELKAPLGGAVVTAALNPDGALAAGGTAEGYLVLWDVGAGRPLAAWEAAGGSQIHTVRFGWTSDTLVSADARAVSAWHFEREGNQALVWRIVEGPHPSGGGIARAALRADGMRAAVTGEDGSLEVLYSGPEFGITTWEEERKTFLEAVEMERFLQGLIMSLILVLAEFFIFAIMTTMVYEKRHDIGVLKSIGFTRTQICLVFLTCGLAIGLLGAAGGVGGGLLFSDNINGIREFIRARTGFDPFPANVYYFTKIPTYVGFATPALTAGGAILCSLLFSIFPALTAARMDPVQTLHYE